MKSNDQRLTNEQKQLVQDNLGLAHTIAKEYFFKRFHANLTRDELLSVAFLGLIHAVIHYKQTESDPRNKRWCRYIIKCIDGFILDEMKKQSLIFVPKCQYNRKRRNKEYLYNKNKENNEQIKLDKIKALQRPDRITNFTKVYMQVTEEEEQEEINIYKYFNLLSESQQQIILLKMQDLQFTQIAKIMGITRQGCYVSYSKSLKILKDAINYE
jgi:RNA polymerase sigma factor (sigma-70 family)